MKALAFGSQSVIYFDYRSVPMERPPPLVTPNISLFLSTISRVDFFITYSALPNEVPLTCVAFLKEMLDKKAAFLIPSDASIHPETIVQEVRTRFLGKTGAIFLPGQKFDATGTRHGRGGGWYDRFLSELAGSYLRIGILAQANLSSSVLVRKPWDQPVDWLIIQKDEEWQLVETGARPLQSRILL